MATHPRRWLIAAAAVVVAASAGGAQHRQTLAPHELNNSDAPPAIIWATPDLPRGPIDFETAEERRLRLVVVARGLDQPWSVAFLPDRSMLVTERVGRLRIIRDGVLDPIPVPGVPAVQTGGARGLQGLMDVALHPRFAEN